MHALPPVPSTLLKLASTVARWTLALLLTVWLVLAAVWIALHWVIVPRIGDFRAEIETRVSTVLGVPIKIGAIAARSGGLIPSIEFSDVKLMDAHGRPALALGRVVAAISPQSVMALGLDQLYIDSPQLDVRRRADGKWVVAGLEMGGSGSSDDSQLADWLFAQKEVVIKNGQLSWTDDLNPQPPMELRQVDLILRNGFRSHAMRVDATPDALLGERFTLMGKFRQPLLSRKNAYWKDWSGQLYANFARVDVAQLSLYAGPGLKVGQGAGALRAWVDIQGGKAAQAVVDVALTGVKTQLDTQAAALELNALAGRLGGQLKPDGFEFHSDGLLVQTAQGKTWPGGKFKIEQSGKKFRLAVDQLDLALLAQVADRLPISEEVRKRLAAVDPKGLVDGLLATWTSGLDGPEKYDVKGKVKALALSSSGPKMPGLAGLSASFDLNDAGGKASLDLANGAIELHGLLEEPRVALAALTGDLTWKVDAQQIVVNSGLLKFKNADAHGEAQFKWHSSAPNESQGRGRFPGVLDLQATVNRIDGASVYRYLPLAILPGVRDYVRNALRKGSGNEVKIRLKGDLYDMPFHTAKQGDFRITAKMADVGFAFAPSSILPTGSAPWPELTQMSGEFVLDRLQLQVKNATGRLVGKAGLAPLQITKADAQIADLLQSPTAVVSGEAKGPLASMVAIVNDSPLRGLTGGTLVETTVTGPGDVQIKLNLPLGALERSTVQGAVSLADSEVRMSSEAPTLLRAKGVVNFSERGFNIPGLQARLFGGDVSLRGGTPNFGRSDPGVAQGATAQTSALLSGVVLYAQGNLSAQAMRQAKELGLVSRLAAQASGAADYTAELKFGQGPPEILVTSNLAGLAVNLPPPFSKPAETQLPVRIQIRNQPDRNAVAGQKSPKLLDLIQIDVPNIAAFSYLRDVSNDSAEVLAGSIAVGLAPGETVPLPAQGVVANVNLAGVDLDAWSQVFTQASGAPVTAIAAGGAGTGGPTEAVQPVSSATNAALTYLPNIVALRTTALSVAGRKFSQVVVGASRDGRTWRGNIDSTELNGYAEYRPSTGSGAGRVYARLARLTLAPASATDVETLLDEQPATMPALDIVVEELELRGKKFGRVEVEAINRVSGAAREWRLAKFNVQMPEATFTATGNWATLNAQAQGTPGTPAKTGPERRRTVMNFKLDVQDSGALLSRFGMKDVIRQGKGKLEGQVAWLGSPLTLDYPTLGGAFNVNMESGQFLKADPGLAKLLGVLSLQSLPRRLALDFRDVFSEGFSFDFVRGDVKIDQGLATTNNLQMKGVNAAVLMEGRADIARETQDLRVIVVPEINAGTASLIATVINPAIGLGTFLAQLILRRPLIETATQEFHIDGTWLDPRVSRVTRKADGSIDTSTEVAK
jgi:uncharacterized protein (TIGR02099 family)